MISKIDSKKCLTLTLFFSWWQFVDYVRSWRSLGSLLRRMGLSVWLILPL
jgi:uncharacterized lipoprotein